MCNYNDYNIANASYNAVITSYTYMVVVLITLIHSVIMSTTTLTSSVSSSITSYHSVIRTTTTNTDHIITILSVLITLITICINNKDKLNINTIIVNK